MLIRRQWLLGMGGAVASHGVGAGPKPAPTMVVRTAAQEGIALKFNLGGAGLQGFCVELVQALEAQDPGLRFPGLRRKLPLKRVLLELAGGQIDVFFSLIDSAERRRHVDFLDAPVLYEARHQLAARIDDPARPKDYAALRALGRDAVILVTHGTVYEEMLRQQGGLNVQSTALSNRQNLEMLQRGRGRFFCHAGSTLQAEIKAAGLEQRLQVLPVVLQVQQQRVAFAPDLDPAVRARVVQALQAVDRKGTLDQLRQRYGVA
ncbi:substrate-binding periplasmic protein [Inhella sp.]|uniref:substrate-binding periplasmic protein n=1 Tax=Inhella sp. TaxID=1921806 RepID=UPI0035AE8F20